MSSAATPPGGPAQAAPATTHPTAAPRPCPRAHPHLPPLRDLGCFLADGAHHAVPPLPVDVPHINLQHRLPRYCREGRQWDEQLWRGDKEVFESRPVSAWVGRVREGASGGVGGFSAAATDGKHSVCSPPPTRVDCVGLDVPVSGGRHSVPGACGAGRRAQQIGSCAHAAGAGCRPCQEKSRKELGR